MSKLKEKRAFLRHPISVPLDLRLENEPKASSRSQDISPAGLSFLWAQKLPAGRSIHITLPVKSKRFHLSATVVYSSPTSINGLYKTGARFDDVASAFQAKLAEEVLEILEFQKKLSRETGQAVPEEEAAERWVSLYARYFSRGA